MMQSIKPSIQSILANKAKLLIAISIGAVAVLSIPVILPHLNHPSMIYHIVLHIVSLVVAVFLTAICAVAYRRSGSSRILFMFFAFLALTAVELIYLFNATEDIGEVALPFVHIELPHIIMLVTLALFGIGVLKVNK
jgi:FtsH-binding integral membrane protein